MAPSMPVAGPASKQPRAEEQKSVRPVSRDDELDELDEDEEEDDEDDKVGEHKHGVTQFHHDHNHGDRTSFADGRTHPTSGRILEEGEIVTNVDFDPSCNCYSNTSATTNGVPWSTEEEFEQAVEDRVRLAVEQEAQWRKQTSQLAYDQGFNEGQLYQSKFVPTAQVAQVAQPYSQLLASPPIAPSVTSAPSVPSGLTEEQRRAVAEAVRSIEQKIAKQAEVASAVEVEVGQGIKDDPVDLTELKRATTPRQTPPAASPVSVAVSAASYVKVGDRCRIRCHPGHRTTLSTLDLLTSKCDTFMAKVVRICDNSPDPFGPEYAGMLVMEFEYEDDEEDGDYTIIRPEHIVVNYGQ